MTIHPHHSIRARRHSHHRSPSPHAPSRSIRSSRHSPSPHRRPRSCCCCRLHCCSMIRRRIQTHCRRYCRRHHHSRSLTRQCRQHRCRCCRLRQHAYRRPHRCRQHRHACAHRRHQHHCIQRQCRCCHQPMSLTRATCFRYCRRIRSCPTMRQPRCRHRPYRCLHCTSTGCHRRSRQRRPHWRRCCYQRTPTRFRPVLPRRRRRQRHHKAPRRRLLRMPLHLPLMTMSPQSCSCRRPYCRLGRSYRHQASHRLMMSCSTSRT